MASDRESIRFVAFQDMRYATEEPFWFTAPGWAEALAFVETLGEHWQLRFDEMTAAERGVRFGGRLDPGAGTLATDRGGD